MKKTTKTLVQYSLYAILGFSCLVGGIVYSRFSREGTTGVLSFRNLLSQAIETPKPVEVTKPSPESTMTVEQINTRIQALESEIVRETNDPERILELRRELYNLRQELVKRNQ
jgi:hypothetical protein